MDAIRFAGSEPYLRLPFTQKLVRRVMNMTQDELAEEMRRSHASLIPFLNGKVDRSNREIAYAMHRSACYFALLTRANERLAEQQWMKNGDANAARNSA